MRQAAMTLMRGDAALQAGHALLQHAALCTVAVDPKAGPGVAPRFLALAWRRRVVLIDVPGTPGLSALLQRPLPFAAADGKRAHHALIAADLAVPDRWACATVCEQLLAAATGVQATGQTPLTTATARFAMPPLPDMADGLDALGAYTLGLEALIQSQSDALLALGMRAVSRLEAAAVAAIAEMEHRGMPFDAPRWRQLSADDAATRAALVAWLRANLQQPDMDVDDDKQLLAALRRAGHAPASGRRQDLQRLVAPWGDKLAELSRVNKRCQAYGPSFLQHVGPQGRIHPTFDQVGANTGRMACHAPNLQAMTKTGGRRSCFAASPGRSLVVADYRACELRILAHLSQDHAFLQAFARGDDVHAQVATRIFGHHHSTERRAEQRQVAKVVSFGLVYGMGSRGLARTLNVTPARAEALQAQYFGAFPQVAAYLHDTEATALSRGYAQTLTGRRLQLQVTATDTEAERAACRRLARNMPIQGTSADIIKLALARLRALGSASDPTGTVNCVHDEIMVECAAADATAFGQALSGHMLAAASGLVQTVPWAVDLRSGQAWSAT
jgi:DNA polymerase-1